MNQPVRPELKRILAAPGEAMSAKQILVMTASLILGLLVYQFFQYLALLLDGQHIGSSFRAYGLLTVGGPLVVGWIGKICWVLSMAGGMLAIMLGFFAIAAINIERLRGNPFLSIRGSIKFAFSRLSQLILAQGTLLTFVLFVAVIFALYGLVARIPYIGEWLYTLLFVLPSFVIAILITFALFVLTLMVLLLPAVAAADRKGETFGAIVETFSTITRQPCRYFGLTAYSLVAAKLASFVYAYFCFRAVQFMVLASMQGGGDSLSRLVKSGLSHLPLRSDLFKQMFNIFPGFEWAIPIGSLGRSLTNDPVTYLMSFMLFLILASVAGYFFSVVALSQAHIYVMIRRIKDDYDIASEEPLFYTEPWANPKIDDSDPGAGSSEQ